MCLTQSRLHEVRDLKRALTKRLMSAAAEFNNGMGSDGLIGDDDEGAISNKQIVLFEYKNLKLTKFLDDRCAYFSII